MELVFTAVTILVVGLVCWLYNAYRGNAGLGRKPMSEWLARYTTAAPVEQHEMAEALLHQSIRLAARMGVQVSVEDLLPIGDEPCSLIARWQVHMHSDMSATPLPTTPARTLGALLLIRQLQPQRYRELTSG
ncbi:hypothetical protein [Phytopseudomonas dryadis]|uniref:Uncharacterized protein n=1 Tax=Phytopseudomonas dryadis TaxID=2487520 RepID=A0A4Q9QUR3_9GAMM|nr:MULTISPECIES: hypothetical protein [Pseudomonas]TBU87018.1 hypothetical protein DNK44_21535 [Pseudomonas dryadis]TBV02082.1 hypothetical protein DNK34_19810 [Pseudomonas dryadis]TBV14811.1 hypothetical protein DNK41_19030 [Pseudomonas sp. FRB 230]